MNNQNNQNNQDNQNNNNYANNRPAEPSPTMYEPSKPAAPMGGAPTDEAPEKKSGKGLIIAIVAVVAAAAVGVGGFFAINSFKDKDEEKVAEKTEEKKESKTGSADEKIEVDIENSKLKDKAEEELSTIGLYPDREVSKKELEDFAGIIDERVRVLGDTYQIEVDDEKIVLLIEKSLLGETAAERSHTMELLISRGNIGFGENEYQSYDSVTKDNISEIKIEEIDRVDFMSDYKVEMMDEKYDQLDKMNKDTIYGLELSLSKEGVSKVEQLLSTSYSDHKMTIVHDFIEDYDSESKEFFGSVVMKEENDLSKLYLVSPAATYKKNAELMKLILEQDEADFGLVIQIADEPTWQTDGKGMGKNQVGSIGGETIVAEFSPDKYTLSYNSEVEFAEYEKLVKERMDVLGIEYMFGTTGFDDKTYCVKVKPEEFAPDFFRMVFGDRSVGVYSSFDQIPAFSNLEVVEENGQYKLRMSTYDDLTTLLAENNIPGNAVYLVVNDVTVATADISQLQMGTDSYTKYYLDFTTFLCFGDKAVSNDEKPFLDLMATIYDGDFVSSEGTFRFRRFNGNKEIEMTDLADVNWKYTTLSAEDERVFAIVTGMGHDIQKTVDKRNMIVITLDVPVDDKLPRNFADEVKKVYEACGFDSGAYNEVQFVIKDETKESPADQCRITAKKDLYDGKMLLNDYVSGPKFSEYWSDFYDITEEEPFFTERDW